MSSYNSFFHVYNRGVKKMPLFLRVEDYQRFAVKLRDYCKKQNLSILTYCIMPNHYHLELGLYGNNPVVLSKMMHGLATSYGMYFNKLYKGSGHVFQGKYKIRRIINDSSLLHVSKYIHQNPAEHTSTRKWGTSVAYMRKYIWSSYREYLGFSSPQIASKNILLDLFGGNLSAFKRYTEEKLRKWELSEIKEDPLKKFASSASNFRAQGWTLRSARQNARIRT